MKSTGIIRKVDELGRVVIPIELRNQFQIAEKDPLEIFVDGSSIVLKKYEKSCLFCGNTKKLIPYKDKLICNKCLKQLKIVIITSNIVKIYKNRNCYKYSNRRIWRFKI